MKLYTYFLNFNHFRNIFIWGLFVCIEYIGIIDQMCCIKGLTFQGFELIGNGWVFIFHFPFIQFSLKGNLFGGRFSIFMM